MNKCSVTYFLKILSCLGQVLLQLLLPLLQLLRVPVIQEIQPRWVNTLIIFEQIIVMWHLSMFSGTRTTSQLGGLLSDWLNNLQTRYRIQSECLLRMLLHICGSRPRCLTNETSFETFIGWIVVVVSCISIIGNLNGKTLKWNESILHYVFL